MVFDNDFGETTKMAAGSVKWFDPKKGFGFIQPEDGSRDIFVDAQMLKKVGLKSLREGQRVQYQINHGPGGRTFAENIVISTS